MDIPLPPGSKSYPFDTLKLESQAEVAAQHMQKLANFPVKGGYDLEPSIYAPRFSLKYRTGHYAFEDEQSILANIEYHAKLHDRTAKVSLIFDELTIDWSYWP